MPYTLVNNIDASRLREELSVLGLETYGSRSDLVTRLQQSGVTQIDTNTRPVPPKLDNLIRFPNHASVLLGNGAIAQYEKKEQFIVQNNTNREPLLSGDFELDIINFPSTIYIKNTPDLSPKVIGKEGDIKRKDGKLYMYRQTNCYKGWYELQFGAILLV
jgi:hypothetical protein